MVVTSKVPAYNWINGGPVQGNTRIIRRLTLAAASVAASTGFTVKATDVASAQEWSDLSPLFATFRVLAIRLSLLPNAGTTDHMTIGADLSGGLSSPANSSAVWGLVRCKQFIPSTTSPWAPTYELKACLPEHFLFAATSTPTAFSNYSVQGFNASSNQFNYYVEFMVEFQGSKL